MDSLEYRRTASTLRKLGEGNKCSVSHLRKNSTQAEDRLWDLIRRDQILGVRFRRQHKVGQFIVDFFSMKYKLAIEVDGEIHKHQIEQDEARTQWIEALGIRVIRFSNDEVIAKPDRVKMEIERVLREQITSPH